MPMITGNLSHNYENKFEADGLDYSYINETIITQNKSSLINLPPLSPLHKIKNKIRIKEEMLVNLKEDEIKRDITEKSGFLC